MLVVSVGVGVDVVLVTGFVVVTGVDVVVVVVVVVVLVGEVVDVEPDIVDAVDVTHADTLVHGIPVPAPPLLVDGLLFSVHQFAL